MGMYVRLSVGVVTIIQAFPINVKSKVLYFEGKTPKFKVKYSAKFYTFPCKVLYETYKIPLNIYIFRRLIWTKK